MTLPVDEADAGFCPGFSRAFIANRRTPKDSVIGSAGVLLTRFYSPAPHTHTRRVFERANVAPPQFERIPFWGVAERSQEQRPQGWHLLKFSVSLKLFSAPRVFYEGSSLPPPLLRTAPSALSSAPISHTMSSSSLPRVVGSESICISAGHVANDDEKEPQEQGQPELAVHDKCQSAVVRVAEQGSLAALKKRHEEAGRFRQKPAARSVAVIAPPPISSSAPPPPPPPPPPPLPTAAAAAAAASAVAAAAVSADKAEGVSSSWRTSAAKVQTKTEMILLVIDYDSSINWSEVFKGATVPGGSSGSKRVPVRVEQTAWDLVSLAATGDKCVVDIRPSPDPIFGTTQKHHRRVEPDFCLIRNVCRGAHGADFRNLLYGLHFAGIPSVNSLGSIIACQERAVIYAELNQLQREMGEEAFPFIQATYHPNLDEALIISPEIGKEGKKDDEDEQKEKEEGESKEASSSSAAVVVKVGTSCAGYGKMRLTTEQQFMDYKTTLSMGTEYFTVEPYCPALHDVRVQLVGGHVRAYKRTSDSWKGNMGNTRYADIPVTDAYRRAAEACAQLFGGLDILSLDYLRLKDGRQVILELNDSMTGFHDSHAAEDRARVRDCVLRKWAGHVAKMARLATKTASASAAAAAAGVSRSASCGGSSDGSGDAAGSRAPVGAGEAQPRRPALADLALAAKTLAPTTTRVTTQDGRVFEEDKATCTGKYRQKLVEEGKDMSYLSRAS